MLGQNGYSLTCSVNGADNLIPTITYQWTKNNGTQTQIQVRTNSNTLSFSHLRLADAGQYTCSVTVRSAYVSSVARARSQPFVVNITGVIIISNTYLCHVPTTNLKILIQ